MRFIDCITCKYNKRIKGVSRCTEENIEDLDGIDYMCECAFYEEETFE